MFVAGTSISFYILKCDYLHTEISVIWPGIVPASRTLESRPGRKVAVRSGLVQATEQAVTHLEHVARVVVHFGTFVL
jgi:hypothetical protein